MAQASLSLLFSFIRRGRLSPAFWGFITTFRTWPGWKSPCEGCKNIPCIRSPPGQSETQLGYIFPWWYFSKFQHCEQSKFSLYCSHLLASSVYVCVLRLCYLPFLLLLWLEWPKCHACHTFVYRPRLRIPLGSRQCHTFVCRP